MQKASNFRSVVGSTTIVSSLHGGSGSTSGIPVHPKMMRNPPASANISTKKNSSGTQDTPLMNSGNSSNPNTKYFTQNCSNSVQASQAPSA